MKITRISFSKILLFIVCMTMTFHSITNLKALRHKRRGEEDPGRISKPLDPNAPPMTGNDPSVKPTSRPTGFIPLTPIGVKPLVEIKHLKSDFLLVSKKALVAFLKTIKTLKPKTS